MMLVACLAACGGHGKLEKAVRSVLVSGDTTKAAYDSLCSLVTENPGKYADLLTPEGVTEGIGLTAGLLSLKGDPCKEGE